MFDEFLFTFRALTTAQNARSVLSAAGIRALVGRTTKRMSANGCAYAVRVNGKSGIRAVHLLRAKGVDFLHVYRIFRNGSMEEIRL